MLQNKPKPIRSFSKPRLLSFANSINLHRAPAPAVPARAEAARGDASGRPSEAAAQRNGLAARRGRHEELLPEAARELRRAKD